MKDEIKEILELYKDDDIEYYNLVSDLGYDKLLDYITNLDEKYKKSCETYQEALDETMSEKMDLEKENQALKNQLDFIEEQNHIIDKLEKENGIIKSQLNICSQDLYMENLKLKQENERLKELCDKYEEEHSTEFKIWKDEKYQLLDYKSRNEKAIEYIRQHSCIIRTNDNDFELDLYLQGNNTEELLNILGGDDND